MEVIISSFSSIDQELIHWHHKDVRFFCRPLAACQTSATSSSILSTCSFLSFFLLVLFYLSLSITYLNFSFFFSFLFFLSLSLSFCCCFSVFIFTLSSFWSCSYLLFKIFLSLSLCLSLSLAIHPSIYLSTYLSIYLSITTEVSFQHCFIIKEKPVDEDIKD
ncbi:unnamed protein product [Acanthosepion pharaonis]|uniref:Uncharacterized protein n=1 Tax=Acanthosepion pharaonis TaxID=158019 RepID=A0A812D9X9_ACAPH|nr:unnamed protein product [Sepia pharaonis]